MEMGGWSHRMDMVGEGGAVSSDDGRNGGLQYSGDE